MLAIIRIKPDAVYERYSCYHFGGVLACKLCRVPVLLEVNSTYAGRFPRRILGFKRLARWIENFDLLEATAVAVVSQPFA